VSAATTFHVRNQANRALELATRRKGKLGGWSREARDPKVLREELERLAQNTLVVCDLLDGRQTLVSAPEE